MNIPLCSSTSRREFFCLTAVVLGCFTFVALRGGEFPIGAGMDDAYYIEIARSLAEGRGPVIHLNGIVPGWSPGIFPNGFPLLLSPVARLNPASVQVFLVVPILALAALIPLCHQLARLGMSGGRPVLTALVCLNPWTIGHAVRVFSDLPFAALSMAALLLFLRLAEDGAIRWPSMIALVAVTAAAIMVRSIGLALPVAMIIFWFWHRRWPRALLLGFGVAAALFPHAVVSRDAGGGLITHAYLQQVFAAGGDTSSRLALLATNLAGYLRELPVVLLPVFGGPVEKIASRLGLGFLLGPIQIFTGILLTAGIVRGLILLGRRNRTASRFLAIYLGLTFAALLNFAGFPTGVQARLLLPLLPLLLLALLLALDQFTGRRRREVFWPVVILMLALSLGHNGYRVMRHPASSAHPVGADLVDPALGSDWIKNHTGPVDLIMTRWPLRQHIHFLRPVVGFGSVSGLDLEQRIEIYGVDYIFLGPGTPDERMALLWSRLLADSGRFAPVHEDAGTGVAIFRVEPVP